MANEFLPLLARGEEYIEIEPGRKGRPSDFSDLPTYEQSRDNMIAKIEKVSSTIKHIPSNLRVKDVVVSMKMAIGYTAKSYYPFDLIRLSGAKDVGSKNQETVIKDKKGQVKTRSWKDIFLRVSEEQLVYFDNILNQGESKLTQAFRDDIRKIEDLYVKDNEQILSIFAPNWETGRVEIILHPLGELEGEVIDKFRKLYSEAGGDLESIKYKSYYPGPVYVSAWCEKETLRNILKFNPLRAAHPLRFSGVPQRLFPSAFPLPLAPKGDLRSSIIVGVFDGGVVKNHPLLKNFVTAHEPIPTFPEKTSVAHGTGVSGAVLYGSLKGYGAGAVLPTPPVSVENYRVLPLSDPVDNDLYEIIDIIEDIVPARNDIQVYNLSLGPEGPLDKEVSRFTHALDTLSETGHKLFCVAVGNDGDLPNDDDRRIQAPADVINGLGVGAHTFNDKGSLIRAPYSCIGEGREGCKVKPDITAFGGSDDYPFFLIGPSDKTKWISQGTSFASPLVAGKAAEIVGRCNVANPLVARALIVHSAVHPQDGHDKYLGYGAIPDSVEEIIGCTRNKVTVLYKQRILPTKYARINLPFLENLDYNGRVKISWTIAIATKTNPIHPDDYAVTCIEDTLYPNHLMFNFKGPKGTSKDRHLVNDAEEIKSLLASGWKQNPYPKSASGNQYQTEEEHRRINFKWDTVIKKWRSFYYRSLSAPYLVIHAMDRSFPQNSDFINYAIAISVDYLSYKGDAYQHTIKNYPRLETVKLKAMNEIMVR